MPKETEGAPSGAEPNVFADAFAAAAAAGGALSTEQSDAPPEPGTPPEGGDAGGDAAPPAEGAPGEPAPAAPAAPEEGTPGAGEAPAEGEQAPAEAPPAGGNEPGAAAPASADDIVKGLADLLKNQPAPAPAPEAPAAPAAEETPLYSAEETSFLAEYAKNWPDVAKAEALARRGEYHDLMKFVFGSMVEYLKEPLETIRQMQNTLHMSELKNAVPDYSDSLETQVNSWIDTQPAYLQAGMKQVMQSGTTEEVADLFQRYKAAVGGTPPAPSAPAAAPAAPPKPPKTELSSAAKQAAEELAPVGAERSNAPAGGLDPNDFMSAFGKYAAEMAGT